MNLKDALEKLEAFTRQQEGRTFPHLFAPESSLLQKTVKLLQIALSDRIKTEHLREAEQVKQDIEYAVRVVKSHHVLLENYKTGSPEQQALAKRASGLFYRFNALVERTAHPQENWKTHIAHLYCKVSGVCIGLELNKIELPPTALIASRLPKLAAVRGTLHTHRITRHPNPNQSEAKIDAVFHQEGFPHPLSRREADAFRGKMFSLLKQHKITFASPAEEVFMVQQAPLQFIQNEDLVTVKTNLYPFPGEEVKIEGVFQRQPEALAPSVPLIDRFSLKYQNIQTGFPYPAQLHGGVTWADQLLPSLPHHPQEIPLIVQLLEQKQKIALQLHENRDFLKEAKAGLAVKRERILADLETYLQLEKRLSIALATASGEEIDIGAIDSFFSNLHQHSAPFDYLADTHQIIVENVLTRPFTRFQKMQIELDKEKGWTQEEVHTFFVQETSHIFKELLIQKGDPVTLQYIRTMGAIMAPPAHLIMLQHLSESLGFAPPMLDPFARKVQAILYYQLREFLREQEEKPKPFEVHLKKEISVYEAEEEIEDEWVNDLEAYFNTRYYERLAN